MQASFAIKVNGGKVSVAAKVLEESVAVKYQVSEPEAEAFVSKISEAVRSLPGSDSGNSAIKASNFSHHSS